MKTLPCVDAPRYCVKLSVLVLLCALAACGGADDDSFATTVTASSNANAPVQTVNHSQEGAPDQATHSPSPMPVPVPVPVPLAHPHHPASSAAASALIGTVIEIAPSSANLTLDQFANEVHANMATRERQGGLPLQWFATFQMKAASPRAFVTIVAVGAGREAAGDFPTSNALTSTASTAKDGNAAADGADYYSNRVLSADEARHAACLGGSPATSREEFHELINTYSDATEAMAVGLPIGTPRDVLQERLFELIDEEMDLPSEEAETRRDARYAIREQRDSVIMQCRGL